MKSTISIRITHLKYSLLIWLVLPTLFFCALYTYIISSSQPQVSTLQLPPTPTRVYNKKPIYTHFNTQGKGAATFLFNNAWKSQYTYGFKYLKNKGLIAAVSATSSYIDYPAFWHWQELQEAQNKGWEIVSQGKSYQCDLNKLSDEEILQEVYGAKQDFLNHGIYVQHFASPCGKVNLRLTDQVSSYYASQKIGEEGINYLPLSQEYLLKGVTINNKTTLKEINEWTNTAEQNNGWVIFVFDQIDDNMEFQEIIEGILNTSIQIVVPSQMID